MIRPMSLPTAAVELFRCPACHEDMALAPAEAVGCRACGLRLDVAEGVIDFVPDERRGPERAFYDDFYRHAPSPAALPTPAALARTWTDPGAPWEMQEVWRRLGELNDRTVLLLGNGESAGELHMLTKRPRTLIYSDLSPVGLRALRRRLGRDGHDNVVFAAMDALDLPLRDESVDLVYGFAFAHHLPDLDRFLAEVARVLRPGGRCVFMDDARSPVWQRLKLGWMRPLMHLSHRREPRSPEDLRETLSGGFREPRLAAAIRRVGGEPRFQRVALLYYLWMRAAGTLFPARVRRLRLHERVARACMGIDRLLLRSAWGRRNMIRLIWGFDKPRRAAAR
jgi:SAM-dependent methyltransferase